jgi:hypothetical protein
LPLSVFQWQAFLMIYIGFDNGVTSNGIGVIHSSGDNKLYKLPVKKEASYTKEEKFIHRIDFDSLVFLFKDIQNTFHAGDDVLVGLERPMVNSRRFNASLSAIRALEATLIAIETLGFRKLYIDSKEWQSSLLPGVKGSDELKKASFELGKKLFPKLNIKKDADGLLIAEYLRRKEAEQNESHAIRLSNML